jgi:hypothetical protein
MKLREAIEILLHSATRDLRGSGQGYRTGLSQLERERLKHACERVWPNVYNRRMGDNDKFNMGF